ncbi:MAG: hypothetical protein KBE09_02550 [Candidatus Pacebacteria bacterium]|nr:hypothetical protein [Candidatus Paceibacterota bacterium]
MRILILADPLPRAREPWYVKEAYVGLLLDVERAFLGDKAPKKWPKGLYLVRLAVVLQAMKGKSPAAYRWLRENKQGVDDILREQGSPAGLEMPFPAECCEEIPEQLH